MIDLQAPLRPDERFDALTIPLHIVDRILAAYPDITAFIETGTYHGATIERVKDQFERVYTIELGHDLWQAAQTKFAADLHVHTLRGDSGTLLPGILSSIEDRRALVWLDAHYSGGVTARGKADTAIAHELGAFQVGSRRDHIIMIDDIDDFTGLNGYPTVEELGIALHSINPDYRIHQLNTRRGVLVATL